MRKPAGVCTAASRKTPALRVDDEDDRVLETLGLVHGGYGHGVGTPHRAVRRRLVAALGDVLHEVEDAAEPPGRVDADVHSLDILQQPAQHADVRRRALVQGGTREVARC